MARLETYQAPVVPHLAGEALEKARAGGVTQRQHYFQAGGGVSLFETMQSLRG